MRIRACRVGLLACPGERKRARFSRTARAGQEACPTKGSALLMVLWITAALAAIGFTLAGTVRGEAERASTEVDDLRAYYLAVGALQRAELELAWSVVFPDKRRIPQGSTFVDYQFPSGVARVEMIPEASKLDVNNTTVETLNRLLVALGLDPARAAQIADAIDDWRRPAVNGSPFDGYYQSQIPSFLAPHASIQEIEELLLVKGITPDIFYGTYVPAPAGTEGPRLVPQGGLMDCLSVYGATERVDANTAHPAVLAALGVSPYVVSALVERRRRAPMSLSQLTAFIESVGGSMEHLRVEGNSIVTMRATAQLYLPDGRLSDLKRTVAAQIKYNPPGSESGVYVLRWYDTAWSH
jgi:general secretion pathway protein K